MGLTDWLWRLAAGHPHALVVTAPGGTAIRLAVETHLRRRGWPTAASPGEADLLVLAGSPGPRLADMADRLWSQLPAPRARLLIDSPEAAAARLEAGAAGLADRAVQWGEMQLPDDLPMAERAPDRDGLKLDQLHLPLGPVLPDWPQGLVVHVAMQGDVVQQADVDPLTDAPGGLVPFWDAPWLAAATGEPVPAGDATRRRAAAHLDSLGRLLGVAGWEDAAVAARRLRDEALAGEPRSRLLPRVQRFARRVRGSRTLRWLTDSLGVLDAEAAEAAGVTGPARRAAGDVTARWERWLAETVTAVQDLDERGLLSVDDLDGPRGRLGAVPPSRPLLAVLPALLDGAELATARLIVASLDPDVDELAYAALTGTPHG